MGDPADNGFAYDEQGRVDIHHSSFFDVNLDVDATANDYVERIQYQLVRTLEDRICPIEVLISNRPTTTPSPAISLKDIDEVINQAQATRSVLGTQRAFFGHVQGKVKQLGDNFPKIRGLLGAISRKRSKDTLILSAVIAACTLFLIIYWLSK